MLLDTSVSHEVEPTEIEKEWGLVGPHWHRRFVGARNQSMWNAMGNAQLELLKRRGLTPSSKFLDVGCGSLRLGVKMIPFLHDGNYTGLDVSERLVRAGIDKELSRTHNWRAKCPRFIITDQFDMSEVNEPVDYAMAQSVWTHINSSQIKECLIGIKSVLKTSGKFYATFNSGSRVLQDVKYPVMTEYPFGYLQELVEQCDLDVKYIGNWGIKQNKRNKQLLLEITHGT